MDSNKVITNVDKKEWVAPRMIVYGTVEEITGQSNSWYYKSKRLGTGDDIFTCITRSIS